MASRLKRLKDELAPETPRDRNGTFEPQIIEKHQTRFTGFDANFISLYALFRLLVHVPPKMPKLDTLARVEKLRVDPLNRERECERIEGL